MTFRSSAASLPRFPRVGSRPCAPTRWSARSPPTQPSTSASAGRSALPAGPADSDAEPTSVYPRALRADRVWAAGDQGAGVTVALVDTGVTAGTDLAGRLLTVNNGPLQPDTPCKNLSGEPTCDDTYGHGTFVAGIIAGNGAASARHVLRDRAPAGQPGCGQGGRCGRVDRREQRAGGDPVGGQLQEHLQHPRAQPVAGHRLDPDLPDRSVRLRRRAGLGRRHRRRRVGKQSRAGGRDDLQAGRRPAGAHRRRDRRPGNPGIGDDELPDFSAPGRRRTAWPSRTSSHRARTWSPCARSAAPSTRRTRTTSTAPTTGAAAPPSRPPPPPASSRSCSPATPR